MEELNKKNLQKAIEELQKHQPPKNLWDNIEHKLNEDAEKPLKNAIDDLPVFQPAIPFENIAQNLEEGETKTIQRYIKKYWVGIAAAITLLLVSIQLLTFQMDNVSDEQITYSESEEILPQAVAVTNNLGELNQDDEVYQVILKQCETSLIKCEKPEFQELLNHYVSLNSESKTLFSGIQNKHQEELMLPHIVRIEKEKSKVGKMLIQLLLS